MLLLKVRDSVSESDLTLEEEVEPRPEIDSSLRWLSCAGDLPSTLGTVLSSSPGCVRYVSSDHFAMAPTKSGSPFFVLWKSKISAGKLSNSGPSGSLITEMLCEPLFLRVPDITNSPTLVTVDGTGSW